MRVCVVYDCLYPWTVGGAERWYRALAERLAADGHRVTYVTLRQWEDDPPRIPGVDVIAVGPRFALYAAGRRRVAPPLVFGVGVLRFLLRHGRDFDVVHGASFPYFPLLAAAVARRPGGYRLVVDWWEVWTRAYWQSYLGRVGGWVGWAVQRRCVRVRQRAFCFSRLAFGRLLDEGVRGTPTVLTGAWSGRSGAPEVTATAPIVVFAGRHIPEKRVAAVVPALAEARRRIPALRATILGDGPERELVRRQVSEHGLDAAVDLPGFVDEATFDATLRRALCLVLPSRREGFGLVVVDAAARGTPTIVVRGPDNAAVELIEDGRNGVVAPSDDPDDLAKAIVRVYGAGAGLRVSTAAWFAANAARLSLDDSLAAVLIAYNDAGSDRTRS